MKPYAIISPTMGLKEDYPSILLKEAWTPDCSNVIFEKGEVHRAKMRLREFSYHFPDNINGIDQFWKDSSDEWWLIVMTKRDIAYRDKVNDRFVFLNKLYTEGTITILEETPKVVTGNGTAWEENLKAGDFIKIGAGNIHTGSDWYEIASVDSDTQLTLVSDADACSGSAYVARKTFNGYENDYWQFVTFNEKWIATNKGIDNIIVWTGSGQVSDLACPYKAKLLFTFENRLILGYTIESGNNYPFRFRWSALGDETIWSGSEYDAGAATVSEGDGTLTGFANLQGFMVIFKERSIIKAWNVSDASVFNKKLVVNNIGCYAANSIIETNTGIYFYAPDNTFRKFTGYSWDVISDEVEPIVKDLNPEYEQNIQALYNEQFNQIMWAVPNQDSTGRLNKVLIYDLDYSTNNWGVLDMEVCCFGSYLYENQMTWDDLLYSTWDTWAWDRWDTREGLAGAPYDIIGGYDGYIYRIFADELDDGEEYEGYITIETDLENKKGLHLYKRALRIDFYFRQESAGSVTIGIKRDSESSFQTAGTVSLVGNNDINIVSLPIDALGKFFRIRLSSKSRFRFLGMVIWSEEVGDR